MTRFRLTQSIASAGLLRLPRRRRPPDGPEGRAGERLLEKALLLARFTEDDAKHLAVPGIGHRLHAGPPAIQERLSVYTIGFEDLPGSVHALSTTRLLWRRRDRW